MPDFDAGPQSSPDPSAFAAPAGGTGQSRHAATLVTGANGEFGHGLITQLYESGERNIVALDLRDLDPSLRAKCCDVVIGDILDQNVLARLEAHYEIDAIYHLAALLSTRGEFTPELAHHVNVDGTLNLLKLAANQAESHGQTVRFLFPSSIAVYGMGSIENKKASGTIDETQFLEPITMYGCNKLSCENLGRYYARHYRQLARGSGGGADVSPARVDFRSIRFPGVISAFTMPSGGTSDYAPEMVHAAAQKKPYTSFVREDTRIPFMTMPDAISALRKLAEADAQSLTRSVYNITAFNPSAGEVADLVRQHFGNDHADITFKPDLPRQAIVDSWPEDTIDAAARTDWGYAPTHNLQSAFADYLVPNIAAHYADKS